MTTTTPGPVAPAEFRALMAGFPTGVGIVTTMDGFGRPWGMTCSSICSVAVEPATLLICLRGASPTLDAMLRRATFALNLLHELARPAAELFASGAADRFERVGWSAEPGFGGPHLIADAHAIADCVVTMHHAVGDHVVVFGEVRRVSYEQPAPAPLLYGQRQYASWPVPTG